MSSLLHTPEDMTVTTAATVTLSELQASLAKAGQWLPIDPPKPALTIREILDRNESGPRRYGYGTPRDYVIGLTATLSDGRQVKSGGQVVKNVAGYDLQKLFIGSGGTLGIISEVTFKLRPIPELERFVQQSLDSLDAANTVIEKVVESELTPIIFDVYRGALQTNSRSFVVVLGFDGTKEDVQWQLALAEKLGFTDAASLDYDQTFRATEPHPRKLSILPSKLIETLRGLGESPFVARAGNGIIFHHGTGSTLAPSPVVLTLQNRLKDAFDPKRLLPELPA